MKIAIATEGSYVSEHFGHCEGFTIYDVKNKESKGKEFVANPGHRPGYLPMFLREKNVDIIISGGMGGAAQQLFNENNISVIVGARGTCDEVLSEYLSGALESTNSVCHEHMHADHCHDE